MWYLGSEDFEMTSFTLKRVICSIRRFGTYHFKQYILFQNPHGSLHYVVVFTGLFVWEFTTPQSVYLYIYAHSFFLIYSANLDIDGIYTCENIIIRFG